MVGDSVDLVSPGSRVLDSGKEIRSVGLPDDPRLYLYAATLA